MTYYVYILASGIGGTLYIGITNDLVRRVYEHRTKAVPGFTTRYGVNRLVYFELFEAAQDAIRREKRLKAWNRAWKIRLLEEHNPNWDDLYPGISGLQSRHDWPPSCSAKPEHPIGSQSA